MKCGTAHESVHLTLDRSPWAKRRAAIELWDSGKAALTESSFVNLKRGKTKNQWTIWSLRGILVSLTYCPLRDNKATSAAVVSHKFFSLNKTSHPLACTLHPSRRIFPQSLNNCGISLSQKEHKAGRRGRKTKENHMWLLQKTTLWTLMTLQQGPTVEFHWTSACDAKQLWRHVALFSSLQSTFPVIIRPTPRPNFPQAKRGASLLHDRFHDMQKFMFIAFSQGTWLIALLNTSASA